MQPNQPQGYWQPDQQPAAPAQPPVPQPQSPVQAPAPAPTQPAAAQPPVPAPAPTPTSPSQPAPVSNPADTELSEPDYDEDDEYDYEDEAEEMVQPVSWQAKEFVSQDKNVMWFVAFGVIIVAMLALAIFLMKSMTFAFVLVAIAVVVIVYANRPARIMSYSLSEKGLYIGDTLHHFADFKSFGVIHDGKEFSVTLIPTKRFQPGIAVYFPEESGEDIVDLLGSRLPMRELKLDMVDHLIRILRL